MLMRAAQGDAHHADGALAREGVQASGHRDRVDDAHPVLERKDALAPDLAQDVDTP